MSSVEVTEREGGGYTAMETESGALGSGETLADALERLAENLRQMEDADPETTYDSVSRDVRRRLADAGVSEDEVEDAIEWARSE